MIAKATGSVVADLSGIPNQPLIFAGTTNRVKEDDLIAYSWEQFLKTGDERWPARLPMTKAVVRAMDTITAVLASPEGGKTQVNQFFVMGASKRGWTTWTTAAVDNRVIGIAPAVIDALNLGSSPAASLRSLWIFRARRWQLHQPPHHGLGWNARVQGARTH